MILICPVPIRKQKDQGSNSNRGQGGQRLSDALISRTFFLAGSEGVYRVRVRTAQVNDMAQEVR